MNGSCADWTNAASFEHALEESDRLLGGTSLLPQCRQGSS